MKEDAERHTVELQQLRTDRRIQQAEIAAIKRELEELGVPEDEVDAVTQGKGSAFCSVM